MSNHARITTTDLDLGAALLATDFRLADLHKNGDGKTVFSFLDSDGRFDRIREQFLSGELLLPADRVLRCRRDLTYRLHGLGR